MLMPKNVSRVNILLLVFALAVLPGLVALTCAFFAQREQLKKAAENEALAYLELVAEKQAEQIKTVEQLLDVLAKVPAVYGLEAGACTSLFKDILDKTPQLANIGLADRQGNLICSGTPFSGRINVADFYYFQQALAAKRFVAGEYAVGRVTGKPSLHLARPLLNGEGEVTAVLYAALGLKQFNEMLIAESRLLPGAAVALVDRQGRVLARMPDWEEKLGLPATDTFLLQIAGREKSGVFWQEDTGGKKRLYAYLQLLEDPAGGRVTACLSVPDTFVYAAVQAGWRRGFWALGLTAVLALSVIVLGGSSFYLLRKAEHNAAVAEQRYRTVFENTGTATILVEEDGAISLANEEFARLAGLPRKEIEGWKNWKDFFANGSFGDFMEEYGRRTEQCRTPLGCESAIQDRAGGRREVYLTVGVLPGACQSVISILDITENKERERKLKWRLELEEIVANISSRFLKEDFDLAVNGSLAEIGAFAGAGRAYLFLFRQGEELMDNTHEWCAQGVVPMKEELQSIPCRVFPWWMDRLRRGEAIHVTDVSKMPDEAEAERKILEVQDIKSLLVLPVLAGGSLAGFAGLDNVEAATEWLEEDIALVRVVAEILGNALERHRLFVRQASMAEENSILYRQARERLAQLEALREIDEAMLGTVDLRLIMKKVTARLMEYAAADACAVMLLDEGTGHMSAVLWSGEIPADAAAVPVRSYEGCTRGGPMGKADICFGELAGLPCPKAKKLLAAGFAFCVGIPLVAKGRLKGALELFFRSPVSFSSRQQEFLTSLGRQAAIAVDSVQMFMDLQRTSQEIVFAYDSTIEALSYALDLRDRETEGHSRRVTEMAVALARSLGVEGEALRHLRRGALLHDIGKLGVPDSILQKPGPLSAEEWEIMRRHPVYAWEMLSPIEHLRPALEVPYCHHEKWDGTGYPRGLKEREIPFAARIFAVVDVWDALCSVRPYRTAWPKEKAAAYLYQERGRHFDPDMVQVFLEKVIGTAEPGSHN